MVYCSLKRVVSLLALSTTLVACRFPAPATLTQNAPTQAQAQKPLPLPTPARDTADYIAALKSKTTGKGLFVFPPVAQSTLQSTDFSTGCARWLQLYVASAPELTRTPPWYLGEGVRVDLERKDLRLTPAQAAPALQILDVTHYALGEATEDKITFQLYERAGKPVGDPLVLTGTQEQMRAALPQIGSALRQRLGLPPAEIAPAKESIEDIALCGRVPVLPGSDLTEKDCEAPHSVLASLQYNITYDRMERSPEEVKARAARLVRLAPENPLVLAEITKQPRPDPEIVAAVQKGIARSPRNLCVNLAYLQLVTDRATKVAAAETMVRAAPGNAAAWEKLASALMLRSEELRQSRNVGEIAPEEWKQLQPLYDRALGTAVEAVKLNPDNLDALQTLAISATFGSNEETARAALERCFSFVAKRRGAPKVMQWALEMNAPKWGGSKELLEQTADRLAALPVVDVLQTAELMVQLDNRGYKKQADKIAPVVIEEANRILSKNPEDPTALIALPHAYRQLGKAEEILKYTKLSLANRPNDLAQQFALVTAYENGGKMKEAAAEADRIVKANPALAGAHLMQAQLLIRWDHYPEAIAPGTTAARMAPGNALAQVAGGYPLTRVGRWAEALPYLSRARELAPRDASCMFYLGETLCHLKRVKEGRALLLRAKEQAGELSWAPLVDGILMQFPEPK